MYFLTDFSGDVNRVRYDRSIVTDKLVADRLIDLTVKELAQ